ncbi:helix-turn-helix transcriptional regulator [Paenibacillus sanguinis]|uniref:helix-turn-helix transcriptional regulator n=1 Tax=Paenibacillus sanguinis TaxID=225906 RepID=UPI000362AFDA|nr:helix-turn-helix transcriptional regulator [Paenibacillus sanguinis]
MLNKEDTNIGEKLSHRELDKSRAKRLGDYLKSRRSRLKPEQAGLTKTRGIRRTPGLRREEVAILAGVSATYYAWLEQGREVSVSREVIESIGRALQLTDDEYKHLLGLWNGNEPETMLTVTREVQPKWKEIVNGIAYPAFITNDRTELLVWNQKIEGLVGDLTNATAQNHPLNMLALQFTEPEMRRRLINWEEMTAHAVGIFRTAYDKYALDPWFAQFVEELSEQSHEFAELWKQHHVKAKKVTRVLYQAPGWTHPQAYDSDSLAFTTDYPDLHLCIFFPVSE